MLCNLFLLIVFDVHCWVQNTILVCYENINFIAVSLPHQSQIWARAQHAVQISQTWAMGNPTYHVQYNWFEKKKGETSIWMLGFSCGKIYTWNSIDVFLMEWGFLSSEMQQSLPTHSKDLSTLRLYFVESLEVFVFWRKMSVPSDLRNQILLNYEKNVLKRA